VRRTRQLSVRVFAVAMGCVCATYLYAAQAEPAAKPAETKPATKPTEAKPEAKPTEAKPAEAQPAEAKQARPLDKSAEAKQAKPDTPAGSKPAGPLSASECAAGSTSSELALDDLLPPLSYEKAMESDLGAHPWQRVRQFDRLHKEIEKRVKLSPEQKDLVRSKFEQIYAQMLKYPMRSAWGSFRYRKLSDEERHNLENELTTAEAAGDKARSEEIRTRMLKGTYGTEQNMAPPIDLTLLDIKDSLDPDQRETFQYLFDRWFVVEPRDPFDVSLRMLGRAIKDPDLKLDPKSKF